MSHSPSLRKAHGIFVARVPGIVLVTEHLVDTTASSRLPMKRRRTVPRFTHVSHPSLFPSTASARRRRNTPRRRPRRPPAQRESLSMPVVERALFVCEPLPDNATSNHPPCASIPFTQNRA
ncbi:hypothetical protein B0H13DRAFT_2348806 [Mycena leptocephala]|nr:hypothetical protein B0H13DRAFT_2348806 [Mycena leptocephala]